MKSSVAWLVSGALVVGLGAVAVLVSLGSPGAVLDDLSAPPSAAPARPARPSSSRFRAASPPNRSPMNSCVAA